jgi:hypothetical protein
MSQEKALQIALGNIDIYTGAQLDDFDPDDPVYRKQQVTTSFPSPLPALYIAVMQCCSMQYHHVLFCAVPSLGTILQYFL